MNRRPRLEAARPPRTNVAASFLVVLALGIAGCGGDDSSGTTADAATTDDAATKDCDTIVGERRAGTDAYATVFTVPGAADNKMDGTLTAGTTYTYRLHCVRGGLSSPFSNEMSGTP